MASILEKIENATFSRRQFLKGTVAATAAVAGLSMSAYADENNVEETVAPMEHSAIMDPEEGGKWVSAACWHNCGGRCMNKVMVKDGVVVRQKTDDTHADSFDYPQQRGCVRGRAQQQQCFGADRIKYPLKRKNWSPENPNGQLRGMDEWERISWDEAIKYVTDQWKIIKEKYGNEAFLMASYGSRYASIPLLAFGGHTNTTDTTSHGTYNLNTPLIGVPMYDGSCNDRLDVVNAETIVFHCSNPAWSVAGTPSLTYIRAKEAGTKFIVIDPIYNASAQMLDAYWIPVRTGTDTALFLGVAHEMLRLDKEKGDIVDWDFLNKYTVGFDADHKPADLKDDVNVLDYINGVYDGVEKTAEWASNICGTPVEKITYLAEALGKTHNVWMMHNFGAARNNGAENLPQIFLTVGCMGGHIGKPGNCVTNNYHANAGNGGPRLVSAGGTGMPSLGNEINKVIPGPQVWDACLNGKFHYVGEFYVGPNSQAGYDDTCDIHCIYHDDDAYLQTGPNMKAGIKAHRKMDFVVSKAQFLTTNAKYSDIILPVTTQWEVPGGITASNKEYIVCFSKVTEPLYEAKTDQDINILLLKGLGLEDKVEELYPYSLQQQFFNQIKGCTYVDENGESQKLVTITQEDIDGWGVEGEPQEGIIGMQEFIDNGGYQVERKQGDAASKYLAYQAFIADPEANPLGTASGKFELTCQAKADLFNSIGLTDYDFKPYPEYMVPCRGYETTFKDGMIGGEKGDYPYLLFNPHYLRRSHSVFNNCPWLRETWPNPVFLAASDAMEKGIENGDTVRVWTEFGEVLRKACVMENMMPGHVGIPHGAWSNVDEATGIDKGGADNYLLGTVISGSGVTGYNNNNCNFEKWEGEPLEDDAYVDKRIITM